MQNLGYVFVASNFRTRFGEIDLIFKHGKRIVFVEVKLRTSLAFGDPLESVTRSKLGKLKKAIHDFFEKNSQFRTLSPSIEVIGILFDGNNPNITHIRNIV